MTATPAFTSHAPRPYSLPPSTFAAERVDGHGVDGHRVLVGLEQDGEGRGAGRGVGGDEVVAAGLDGLPAELAGDVAEFVFEERRDAATRGGSRGPDRCGPSG